MGHSIDALPYFRVLATEFSQKADDEVNIWLDMTKNMVSRTFFGHIYPQALALMAAHRMKLAEMAEKHAIGIAPVASISEDGASMSFALNQTDLQGQDGLLMETAYGRQYLEIKRGIYGGGV